MAGPTEQGTDQPHRTRRQVPSAGAKPENRGSRKDAVTTRAGKKAGGAKPPTRRALGRQAAQELLKLRPILKEVQGRLLDRLDGDLAGLAHRLDGGRLPGETPVLPKAPVLAAMLADIQALKLKPKKGRVKDLRRIQALLDSLRARIPPGD